MPAPRAPTAARHLCGVMHRGRCLPGNLYLYRFRNRLFYKSTPAAPARARYGTRTLVSEATRRWVYIEPWLTIKCHCQTGVLARIVQLQ
ncbi:hypothetical protein EVAR_70134_1 [Eumeta japonica]|uniref:Uncharacterized protein n=1 Tax=Eumeta variegata TaxID=151549 RepID=A0A4C1Z2U7_EUMVA|nr:hypothetical protein EVAR_70134_1 [Eumeta japonica]